MSKNIKKDIKKRKRVSMDTISRLEAVTILLKVGELTASKMLNNSVKDVLEEMTDLTGISATSWSQHAKKNLSPIMTMRVKIVGLEIDKRELKQRVRELEQKGC